MSTRAGSKIGRYEILAEVGRGAMGVVYRARDPKIDRLVAIKTISLLGQDHDQEIEYRERFVVEAQAAGRLSHPGIVTIFDVGEEPETQEPYIVMEYVAGESLKKMLSDGEHRIPLGPALQMAQELAGALHFAHAQGVVHRDIKPANILITPERHAKIADFGIAKLNLSNLTLPGQLLGSPSYMSPEQLRGDGVDARSDLFSLGVVIYTMITGYRPFQGNSATTVCFKVVNQEPLPVTAYDAGLPNEVDRILAKAMAKDPGDRYQSAAEMADAIASFRVERNLMATGTSGTESWFVGSTDYSAAAKVASSIPVKTNPNLSSQLVQTQKWWAVSKLRTAAAVSVFALALMAIAFYRMFPFGNQGVPLAQVRTAPTAPVPAPNFPATTNEAPPVSTAAAPAKHRRAAAPASIKSVTVANAQPLPVALMSDSSTMQVEIDHPFKDATAMIWLDNQLIYQKSLHGGLKKHAVLFREIQGHQSDSLQLAPGKHLVHVRIQTPDDAYDQSKTLSAIFQQSGEMVLHIHCAKQGGAMDVTLQ